MTAALSKEVQRARATHEQAVANRNATAAARDQLNAIPMPAAFEAHLGLMTRRRSADELLQAAEQRVAKAVGELEEAEKTAAEAAELAAVREREAREDRHLDALLTYYEKHAPKLAELLSQVEADARAVHARHGIYAPAALARRGMPDTLLRETILPVANDRHARLYPRPRPLW